MAELADALDSGSSRGNPVQVRFLSGAPNFKNPNPRPVGVEFGFVFYYYKKEFRAICAELF